MNIRPRGAAPRSPRPRPTPQRPAQRQPGLRLAGGTRRADVGRAAPGRSFRRQVAFVVGLVLVLPVVTILPSAALSFGGLSLGGGAVATAAPAQVAPDDGPGDEPADGQDENGPVAVVRLDGRGHGHGVGLSQWGAYTMARNGAGVGEILGTFYPGTELATTSGEVAVVLQRADRIRLRFPGGGEIRSARSGPQHEGFPVAVEAGGLVEIVRRPNGFEVTGPGIRALSSDDAVRFSATGPTQGPTGPAQSDCVVLCDEPDPEPEPCNLCTPPTTAPPSEDEPGEPSPGPENPTPAPGPTPTPTQPGDPAPPDDAPGDDAPPAAEPGPTTGPISPTPVWGVSAGGTVIEAVDRGRNYRGVMEVVGAPGAVKLRNHIDVEHYLLGLAEVPGTWPANAVQAQTIAARTFALRAMAAAGELCDSESCQVYAGAGRESAGQHAAVEATRGVVVVADGRLASTFYSASGGGVSATVAEGFGANYDIPYLQAKQYPTENPKLWERDVALTDVAARLGYPGAVTVVRVDRTGPSGRPTAMTVDGDAGPVEVDPNVFRRRLGLQSNFFTVTMTTLDEAPPPPPDADPGVVGTGAELGLDSGSSPAGSFGRYLSVLEAELTGQQTLALAGAGAGLEQLPELVPFSLDDASTAPAVPVGLTLAVLAFAYATAARTTVLRRRLADRGLGRFSTTHFSTARY